MAIFATPVGVSAMQKLVASVGAMSERPELRKVMDLRTSDCIAVRIWFDTRL
jgi:hypothetical protein